MLQELPQEDSKMDDGKILVLENQSAPQAILAPKTGILVQRPKADWASEDGSVLLYCADNKDIKVDGIDHVITDPPYGDEETHDSHMSSVVLKGGYQRQSLGFEGITCGKCVELAVDWINLAARWVVFTCETNYMHALNDAGVLIRFGIWRKPDGAPQFTGDRPGTGWEAIAICHREGKKRWNGGGKHAFYTFPKGQNKTGHPTGKPLGLFTSFVKDFTDPGETIFDPFMGRGTTGLACAQTGRKFIGIEKDRSHFDYAMNRIKQELSQSKFAL